MLDKVLVDIAKEYNLKITKDVVFGLYKGQLISLAFASNNQYTAVIRLDESRNLVNTLSTKENKKILHDKLKSMQVNVQKEAILFNGIPCGLREKTRSEKLRKMLNEVCIFLADFQSFEDADINNIILLGSTPVIRSEVIIAKTKQDLKQEREKEIDYQKGFLISSVGTVAGSCIAGLASGLMNIKLYSDLNAFGKAIFVVFCAAFLYRKFGKGVDKVSKWLIGGVATLGFMFWEISRYAILMKYKGMDFTFNALVELFQSNINTETVIGRFTLLSLGTIWVWVFFFVARTDTVVFSMDEGEFIDENKMKEFELASKGNWYSGFLFFCGFIALLVSVLISVSVHGNFTYFEHLPFLYIGLLVQGVLWFIFSSFRKKNPALDATMKTYGLRKMPKWFDALVTHLCLALYSGALCFIVSWANITFDTTEENLVTSQLLEVYTNKNQCQLLSFQPKEMDDLSMRVCKSKYGFLVKDMEAIISYKKGFLQIPYALAVSFPALDTFEGYMRKTGKISELRKINILHFYNNDSSDKFQETMKSWESQCEGDDGAYCRFAAYIYGEKKEVGTELKLLNKGCGKKDAVSCYGIVLHKQAEDAQKDLIIIKMKDFCAQGHGESCHYLGHSYESYKALENKSEIASMHAQACRLGVKVACDH